MKSTLISLIILIMIFVLLKCGALTVLGSKAFHYSAFILLITVTACAFYFVGIGGKDNFGDDSDVQQTKEDKNDDQE